MFIISINHNMTVTILTRQLLDIILALLHLNHNDLVLQDILHLVERGRFADLQSGGTIMMMFAKWKNIRSTLEYAEIVLIGMHGLAMLLEDTAIIEGVIKITATALIRITVTQALLLIPNLHNAEEVHVRDIVLDWTEESVIVGVTCLMESFKWTVGQTWLMSMCKVIKLHVVQRPDHRILRNRTLVLEMSESTLTKKTTDTTNSKKTPTRTKMHLASSAICSPHLLDLHVMIKIERTI